MKIMFGKWDPDIHENFEQVRRIEESKKLSKKNIDIDEKEELAKIKESDGRLYYSTLENCTCMDYAQRQLPCKHMYYLAFELGKLGGLPAYIGSDGKLDIPREIERFKELYLNGNITADSYVKICTALDRLK